MGHFFADFGGFEGVVPEIRYFCFGQSVEDGTAHKI
jgi:hypothetical protein